MRTSSRVIGGWLAGVLALVGCSSAPDGSGANPGETPAGTGVGSGSASGSTTPLADGPLGSGSGSGSTATSTCMVDSDCDTHDACEAFSCDLTSRGEFPQGHCVYTAVDGGACVTPTVSAPPPSAADAGLDSSVAPPAPDAAPPTVGLPPIDPMCTAASSCGDPSVFPPYVPLVPPDVPATCSNGFQVADVGAGAAYVLNATNPGGASAVTLDVDFATYLEPDGVTITGVDAQGATYTLLDTCRIQTYDAPEPTNGMQRPPDETIRQFRIDVKQGTTSLTVTFAHVCSPMYLQVLGLCDFDVPSYPHGWWQAVP